MTTLLAATCGPTANERLKESFNARVWLCLIIATFLHILPFRFWPEIEVEDWGPVVADVIDIVQLPPVDLPAEPAPPSRPALPVISANVSAAATIDPVDWRRVVELPPPPPKDPGVTTGDTPPFVVYDTPPRLANPDQVQRTLMREYPSTLRDAGIGGMVSLMVHIDEAGRVLEARVGQGSGYESLDAAALRVADVMRFSPAMNRDIRVGVWIQLPLTFQVR